VAEVEARIHKVLDLRVNPNSGVGLVPLRRGISCIRVSKSSPILAAFVILSFHYARDLAQGLGAVAVSHGMPTCPPMQPGRR
jgi:hypothetical protein